MFDAIMFSVAMFGFALFNIAMFSIAMFTEQELAKILSYFPVMLLEKRLLNFYCPVRWWSLSRNQHCRFHS